MTEQEMDKEELNELRKENAELRKNILTINRENKSLRRDLSAAHNEVERQRKIISDYGWQTNPDRMGR